MIVPHSIGVEGLGYGPRAVATQGLSFVVAVLVEVKRLGGGGLGILPEWEKVDVLVVSPVNFASLRKWKKPFIKFVALSDGPEVKVVEVEGQQFQLTVVKGVLIEGD